MTRQPGRQPYRAIWDLGSLVSWPMVSSDTTTFEPGIVPSLDIIAIAVGVATTSWVLMTGLSTSTVLTTSTGFSTSTVLTTSFSTSTTTVSPGTLTSFTTSLMTSTGFSTSTVLMISFSTSTTLSTGISFTTSWVTIFSTGISLTVSVEQARETRTIDRAINIAALLSLFMFILPFHGLPWLAANRRASAGNTIRKSRWDGVLCHGRATV